MEDNLQNKIKALERELRDLKANQGYISLRPASFKSQTLAAGTHTITYADGDYPPITFFYANGLSEFTLSNITTPNNNTQYFDLSYEQGVQIISTRPIISVV